MTDPRRERVALYARYSSDMQSKSSAQDQIDLLRRVAELRESQVVAEHLDEGLSGATLNTRPQALALLEAARRREFDVVMCEALDRLSRDQEDTARIFKHLTFAGVRLETLSEGRISELHVGLTGTMNQLYLAELARKTRRGLMARVQAGFSGGGRCYGYARRGRGVLAPHEAEAEVVRSIFEQFAEGESVNAICEALNARGVVAPRGALWRNTTLLGSPRVGDGILNQQLYVGQRVFNRRRFRKHPETGRRSSVINPPDEWVRRAAPELRIINDALWERVQRRRADIGGAHERTRRPRRFLSGLMFCSSCGGPMTLCGSRYGCSGRRERRACSNPRTIGARKLELRVLDDLLARLTPATATAPCQGAVPHEELAQIEERLSRLRSLYVAGEIGLDRLRVDAAPFQAQRLRLQRRLSKAGLKSARGTAVLKHIVEARAELASGAEIAGLASVRLLVERVNFTATAAHGGFDLDVTVTAAFAMAEKSA